MTITDVWCARCLGHHAEITVTPLTHPDEDGFQYWYMCPITQEPVLVKAIPVVETV